jgi:succinoglycan biosynthesis transport protein ExoP
MEASPLTLRDYLLILRRRKWSFLLPAALVLALAVAAAQLWPPTFRSEATILIEDAEIPEELVGTLVNDYVEKRLESIDRRVMTTDSLLGIVRRYELYVEERKTRPFAEVAEKMRSDIKREMIRANVVDPKSGQKRSVSVAFTLSFDYGRPEIAQRITNELVTLYLNENLRQRRDLTTDTAGFLRGERERVEQQIREVDAKLAEFKSRNADVLPERLLYNQQLFSRAEQDLRELDRQIQSLKERESYIAAELAQLEPYMPDTAGAQSPAARLQVARAELAMLTSRYGGTHPDVIRARREVEILEKSVGPGGGRGSLQQDRAAKAAELATLRQHYTDEHPDVRRAQRELAVIDDALRVAGPASVRGLAGRTANPAYVTLQAQLAGIRTDLEASLAQRARVETSLTAYQGLLLRTPAIEGEYAALRRQLADAMALRDDIAAKEMATRLTQSAETELKGERLSLIEPPSLPDEPTQPNRTLILLVGLGLAIGTGGGMVTLRQLLDDAIWAPRDITELLGASPLAVVPRIASPGDRARHWATATASVVLVLLMIGGGIWLADRRYGPLDVYAYELQRRVANAVGPYLPTALKPLVAADGAS